MASLTPLLTLDCSADESLVWLKERLAIANLRTVQTFDLSTARHSLEDCPCPHHGTDQCDCQLVVLLVYANYPEPTTLIVHGNDGQTWLSIVERPAQQPSKESIRAIQKALAIQESAGI